MVSKHFDYILPYIKYMYLELKENLLEMLREMDTINAKLQELTRVMQ